ncbi:MAG TPA: hypothetical protein VD788_00945, partial [Candidatus Polarisedimenticolaceae bacterium]|nr:hypothetical protein [Candidatus Polarisedimenticolaceae bacterium]
VTRDASGRPTAARLLRSWRETVKIAGRDESRRVEIVYDYAAGVARRRSYAADGALIADQPLAAQPQPSPEEVSDAVALLRADADLGVLAERVGAVFDGGFTLEEGEGKPCGPGARCLQIFMLSQSRFALHRRTAVDVRAERIAHRSYQPPSGE